MIASSHDHRDAAGCFDVDLVTRVADARDDLLYETKLLFRRVIDSLGIRLGPGRDNQRGGGPTLQVWFAGTIEILPDLFRDKGHERVQEAQALVEYGSQDTSRGLAGCIITLHLHFGDLDIPVTVV